MSEVTVRFVGGPADDLVRALPAGPDGAPPRLWVLRRPESAPDPAADHLYARQRPDGTGDWTMRFVRTDPVGVTE
ncbi:MULTISPECIES: hypothetical protein [unclassified Micromonospora]|uniref:hypothetical protein n=1 Tax=unclassified Micromonospora TaxID=2617518 RepID=UPI0010345583|nr:MULTISPECIES: hypothetical protein [unclassified Micromonospora]QKW14857.1 hypothetical protein HUT12_20135 [Verrucosispora sp. NA02020]TBL29889.1 hypothetical protein EYA84_23660 [Verrucosispora sp. SN26_14.1]